MYYRFARPQSEPLAAELGTRPARPARMRQRLTPRRRNPPCTRRRNPSWDPPTEKHTTACDAASECVMFVEANGKFDIKVAGEKKAMEKKAAK